MLSCVRAPTHTHTTLCMRLTFINGWHKLRHLQGSGLTRITSENAKRPQEHTRVLQTRCLRRLARSCSLSSSDCGRLREVTKTSHSGSVLWLHTPTWKRAGGVSQRAVCSGEFVCGNDSVESAEVGTRYTVKTVDIAHWSAVCCFFFSLPRFAQHSLHLVNYDGRKDPSTTS